MQKSIRIVIQSQSLLAEEPGKAALCFPISTALKGVGGQRDSGKTPLGRHIIRAKIGQGLPSCAVFVGRRWTGEIYTDELARKYPQRDWILSRILWLSGCEVAINRLGDCDSMQRYIYIHGTPDSEPMGEARSHGCIRMRNDAVIELFHWAPVYCPVEIIE